MLKVNNKDINDDNDVVLVPLLLTLNWYMSAGYVCFYLVSHFFVITLTTDLFVVNFQPKLYIFAIFLTDHFFKVFLNYLNPLQPGFVFLYPPTFRFSVFWRYRKATLGCNGLMTK